MLAQFLMLSLLVSSTVDEQSDQLKRLVELHSKARNAIRTLHCTVEVRASEPFSPFNLTGTFWKNGNDYRLATNQLPSSKFAVRKQDTVFKNGQWDQYSVGQRSGSAVLRKQGQSTVEFGNPFQCGLLMFYGLSMDVFKLEQLLENDQFKVASIRVEKKVSHEEIVLKLNHQVGYYELVFDGSYGYLARQFTMSVSNDKMRSVHMVETFEQIFPNVYFPTRIVLNNFVDGKERENVKTQVKIISGNKPVSPDAIKLGLPPGNTRCTDKIRNEYYYVDSNASRVGPLYDQNWKQLSTQATQPSTQDLKKDLEDTVKFQSDREKQKTASDYYSKEVPKFTKASTEEPGSWSPIILVVSSCVLVLGLVLAISKNYTQSSV